MIIAIVSDAIYPYHKGGKEKKIYELSTRLVKMGNEVNIYTMKWWEGPKDIIEDGVILHGIGKYRPLYVGEIRSIRSGIMFGFACLRIFNKKFDIVDVDHIPYFPLYSVWLICQIRRKPMFGTWHEVWGKEYWKEYLGGIGIIAYLIERISVCLPTKIIPISTHTADRLKKILKYTKEVEVLSPGIDFKGIKKVIASKKQTDLIFAGRLIKHKNVDMLIRTVAELKKTGIKTKCLIIGEGPDKKRLLRLSENIGVENLVTFHDFYRSPDEVYSLIKSSKVFVLPSSREGFGIVAVEANACGVPVVTNSVMNNAAKDLVTNGVNGYHFDNSINSLAESIKEALINTKLLENKCVNFARSFDLDKLAKHTLEIYSE